MVGLTCAINAGSTFLRKSLKFVCVFGHDDITALMKVLHDMLLPRYGAARYRCLGA